MYRCGRAVRKVPRIETSHLPDAHVELGVFSISR